MSGWHAASEYVPGSQPQLVVGMVMGQFSGRREEGGERREEKAREMGGWPGTSETYIVK